MLTQTIFTAGALLSIAAAVPMAQQNKRDYIYETTTIKEVTTVDVTTTVWLSAGETAPAHYGHGHHSKVTTHITQTTTVPAKAPATESSPAEQSTYEAPSPSVPVAPTTSTDVPRAVTTSAAPAPTTSSPSSGGSAPSGDTHSGDGTYYSPGMGSCGITNTDSDFIVALAEDMMTAANVDGNPNHNPLCGKSITISYGGKTATAKIEDTCPGCSGAGLDMTPTLFQTFAELSEGRIFNVEWWYN